MTPAPAKAGKPAKVGKPAKAGKPAAAKPARPALPPPPPITGVSSPATGRARLLVDGARFGEATLSLVALPELHLPTGELVACDPFEVTGPAFARRAARGRHVVQAAVATYPAARGPGEQRLAAVVVWFSRTSPARWEAAAFADDPTAIDPAYITASGAGCFMDARTQTALAAEPSTWPTPSYKALERQLLDGHRAAAWGWASYQPDASSPRNCLAFLGGGGQVRRTYWGLDLADRPVCILTDLECFPAEAWAD